MNIYLDNNATTKPLPEVVDAMEAAMGEMFGNPSSPHSKGHKAREALEIARDQVANLIGADASAVFFTSGGTEANNIAIQSLLGVEHPKLLLSAVEHSSVKATAEGLEALGVCVETLPVDGHGQVSLDTLSETLKRFKPTLVSVQWANSETGIVQPIAEIGEACSEHGALFHVDAAQGVGRMPIEINDQPIDYLTLTAHKIHGPQGVGALCLKNPGGARPIMFGGDHEGRLRPGTENSPGIAGFGAAAGIRQSNLSDAVVHMTECRDLFEYSVHAAFPDVQVNGRLGQRVANTSNLLFPGVDGMAVMAQLDNMGISCSMTSACVTARPEPSYVLKAMGLSEADAFSSLRFSFSVMNEKQDAEAAAVAVCEVYERLLSFQQVGAQR